MICWWCNLNSENQGSELRYLSTEKLIEGKEPMKQVRKAHNCWYDFHINITAESTPKPFLLNQKGELPQQRRILGLWLKLCSGHIFSYNCCLLGAWIPNPLYLFHSFINESHRGSPPYRSPTLRSQLKLLLNGRLSRVWQYGLCKLLLVRLIMRQKLFSELL